MQDSHSCDPGSIPGQCTFLTSFFFLIMCFLFSMLHRPAYINFILLLSVPFTGFFLIQNSFFLQSLLAPITDLHYRCIVDDGQKTLTQ